MGIRTKNALKWMAGSIAWILAFLIMNAESATRVACPRDHALARAMRSARELTGLETIEKLSVRSTYRYEFRFSGGKRANVAIDPESCDTLEVETYE